MLIKAVLTCYCWPFIIFSSAKSQVSEERINSLLYVVEIAKADLSWGLVINWELVVRWSLSVLAAPLERIRVGHAAACLCQGSPCIRRRSVGIWHTVGSCSVFFVWKSFRSIFDREAKARSCPLCLSLFFMLTHTCTNTCMQTNVQTHTVPLKWELVQ